MNRLRSAALVAALVPVAQVAVSPVAVSAQCVSGGCPPSIPEPAALLMLGPAAAWLIRRQKK